jgi:MoaA/NifB/PqqE/SkfB family radical SAM enzyme
MIVSSLEKINKRILPSKYQFGPKWIVLGVNNVCNLHCKMCDVGTQNLETNFAQNLVGSKPLNMPLELFKKVIDDTANYFPGAKIGYAFTEPLVYPQLKESLIYASEKGLTTTITTNALNLKRKTEDLMDGKVDEIYISLDGLEETHNEIRGNKKSFQKAIEGIEYIKSLPNSPDISIFCVITEWNISELKKFVDYFSKLPIKHLGFMHQNFVTENAAQVHNTLYGGTYHATHSNIEETDFSSIDLLELRKEIRAIKDTKYPFEVTFSPNIESAEALQEYYYDPQQKIGKICNDAFTALMVKTDGTVIPAHGRCYNVSMGSLYENNLKEIWMSSAYGQFRKDLMKAGGLFPACTRCCSAF